MKRPPDEQRLEMERRIRIGHSNGKSVLWLSRMSGLSTDEVMTIVAQGSNKD